MPEIVIRRCTLRVVRHGGWSWGADRRHLLERATQALPRLIAGRLEGLLEESEGEIAPPLRVRVPLRAASWGSEEEIAGAIAAAIRPEMFAALRRREPGATRPIDAVDAGAADWAANAAAPMTRPEETRTAAATPLALLLRWRAQGDLPRRLRGFSVRALELWLEAALHDAPADPAEPAVGIALTKSQVVRVYDSVVAVADAAVARAITRLILVLEVIVRQGRPQDPATLRAKIDEWLPGMSRSEAERMPASLPRETERTGVDPWVRSAETRAGVTPLGSAVRPLGMAESEIALASVLPFLVLGALDRIGWLETAAAALRALSLPDDGAVFAAALALKTLPTTARGGPPGPELQRAAAAFAGLRSMPSPMAFRDWCSDAQGGLSPLAGFIATEMANGHDPQLPLLITRSASTGSWLLLDGDGRMPVAWESDATTILQRLGAFGPAVVLVSAAAAEPALFRDLVASRRGFVTAAPPGRGENWRRLPGAVPHWAWSADRPLPRLIAASRALDELEASAAALTSALFEARPIIRSVPPTHAGDELDRAAALVAATGLGMLAWTLWRKREAVEPLLALHRLGDLDGTARVSADAIEIRPSIGRRYLDLKDHRLLGDVRAVPWLAGRTIRFVGP